MSTPNIPLLIHVLSDLLPALIREHSRPPHKPIRLVVVDALAELFHSSNKTTTQTLVERSRNICEISGLLHSLASRHRIAILVLNEVSDVFDRPQGEDQNLELIYNDQSRWFSRADSVPGQSGKEAALGLVWANQVNTRIMLSRTGRRRYLEEVRSFGNKLVKVSDSISSGPHIGATEDSATLIRRLSIIFSSIAPPDSLDYIVTLEGVSTLPDIVTSHDNPPAPITAPPTSTDPSASQPLTQVSPLDRGCAEDASTDAEHRAQDEPEVDEWESYWNQDEISEDAYNSVNDNHPDV